MSNRSKKFTTLAENYLIPILLLGVVACAVQPQRRGDLQLKEKPRMMKLETERAEKPLSVESLEAKRFGKGKISPKAFFHPQPKPSAVPSKKLVPHSEGLDEESLDAFIGDGEESVTDSSQEHLHFYYLGYQQLSEGKTEAAVRNLEHFLLENPTHVYADRAQYLIAEAYCKAKEFHLCLLASNILETRYPYSLKVPDGIYLKIQALKNMGQVDEASKTFSRLNRMYPDHPSVQRVAENPAPVKVPPPLLESDHE